jgi:hypothetical protein
MKRSGCARSFPGQLTSSSLMRAACLATWLFIAGVASKVLTSSNEQDLYLGMSAQISAGEMNLYAPFWVVLICADAPFFRSRLRTADTSTGASKRYSRGQVRKPSIDGALGLPAGISHSKGAASPKFCGSSGRGFESPHPPLKKQLESPWLQGLRAFIVS